MDRYSILTMEEGDIPVHKSDDVRNSSRLCSTMQACINNNYILDVSDITSTEIVDKALTMISKRIQVPIVTGTEKSAALFKVMHNYSEVYFVDRLPERFVEILVYHDLDVSKYSRLKPLLILKKS